MTDEKQETKQHMDKLKLAQLKVLPMFVLEEKRQFFRKNAEKKRKPQATKLKAVPKIHPIEKIGPMLKNQVCGYLKILISTNPLGFQF